MADKSEWKTPSMESEGKFDGHQYGRKPRAPCRANPNSWETHLVRKRWDIGLLRALSLRIMMMKMILSYLNICLILSNLIFILSLSITAPRLWNDLPPELRTISL